MSQERLNNQRLDQRFVEKLVKVTKTNGKKDIVVSHITIRQSIFFLILKLIFIEILAAGTLTLFHTLVFTTDVETMLPAGVVAFNLPIFFTLVVIKTFVTFFVIFQWLEEYYEITPVEIIHKKGYLFKSEEHHSLTHLTSLKINQDIFGRIFNYGTLTIFNWAKNREVDLYLIHNPMKYAHILEHLLPEPDEDKEVVREHILEPEKV